MSVPISAQGRVAPAHDDRTSSSTAGWTFSRWPAGCTSSNSAPPLSDAVPLADPCASIGCQKTTERKGRSRTKILYEQASTSARADIISSLALLMDGLGHAGFKVRRWSCRSKERLRSMVWEEVKVQQRKKVEKCVAVENYRSGPSSSSWCSFSRSPCSFSWSSPSSSVSRVFGFRLPASWCRNARELKTIISSSSYSSSSPYSAPSPSSIRSRSASRCILEWPEPR